MIAYIDASVALRLILGERGQLQEWHQVERGISSALAEVECLRTLDRLAQQRLMGSDDLAERRAAVYRLFEALEMIDVTGAILRRAAESFPTPLGTLDAIHLATALLWRDATGLAPVMATHDKALSAGARALGLVAIGA